MFDVFADEICFEHRRVARFEPDIPATLRDEAAEWLTGDNPPGYIKEADHEKALEEACREAEEDGKDEGREEGRRDREEELREEHEDALKLAYANGKRAGAEAAGKVEDVARLDALLARVSLAEAKLRGALNGVQDTRFQFRKLRALKVAEFKTVVRECFLELQHAKIEFGR